MTPRFCIRIRLLELIHIRKNIDFYKAFRLTSLYFRTMINGLGVLGWGVGGIEAEAVMLGQVRKYLKSELIESKILF